MEPLLSDKTLAELNDFGYESIIKATLGYNFGSMLTEFYDIGDMNADQLRRHIERLENDKTRFKNQIFKRVNEPLYFFNNCYNMQKYINKLKEHMEPTEKKEICTYILLHYKELISKLTLKYQGLKSESLQKQKEHIKEHASEEIICDCGASVSRRHIARHKLTKKHLDNMPLSKEE